MAPKKTEKTAPPPRRTERVELRLTEDELGFYADTAVHAGLSVSDMIREAVALYANRGDAERMAALGREVVELVEAAKPRRGR